MSDVCVCSPAGEGKVEPLHPVTSRCFLTAGGFQVATNVQPDLLAKIPEGCFFFEWSTANSSEWVGKLILQTSVHFKIIAYFPKVSSHLLDWINI